MPLIRVLQDNDTPLFFSAGQFRHLDRIKDAPAPHEAAKSAIVIDKGDGSGLQTYWLKTTGETVAEQVQSDSAWYGRMVDFETAEGGRTWLLPSHVINIEGVVPPGEAELAEMDELVTAATEAVAELPEDDQSAPAVEARQKVLSLQIAASNRRTFAGLHSKISLLIPSTGASLPASYLVREKGDEVDAILNPPQRRPGVNASPVREDRPARRQRSKT